MSNEELVENISKDIAINIVRAMSFEERDVLLKLIEETRILERKGPVGFLKELKDAIEETDVFYNKMSLSYFW